MHVNGGQQRRINRHPLCPPASNTELGTEGQYDADFNVVAGLSKAGRRLEVV